MYSYTSTPEDTVKVGLRGGCDLDCGGFYQQVCPGWHILWYLTRPISIFSCANFIFKSAYDKKTITDDDLNLAMTRLFTHRYIRTCTDCHVIVQDKKIYDFL